MFDKHDMLKQGELFSGREVIDSFWGYIPMVEHVCRAVEVVEALRREHHAHIVAPIKQWYRPQEEVLTRNLRHSFASLQGCSFLTCLIQYRFRQ